MSQLDGGLCLSPQRLRSHKTLKIKRVFPREHGNTQLGPAYAQARSALWLCRVGVRVS